MTNSSPHSGPMIVLADLSDAAEILQLQKLAFQTEAKLYGPDIPPLRQTLQELEFEFQAMIFFKAVSSDGTIIGSIRSCLQKTGTCMIYKLMVHPEFRNRGLGSALLQTAEKSHPTALRFELFTGAASTANIRLYHRLGYQEISPNPSTDHPQLVTMIRIPATN